MKSDRIARSAALAGAIALVFFAFACAPLLFFPVAVVSAPGYLPDLSIALWSAYASPLSISPAIGQYLDSQLLLESQSPAVAMAPQVAALWLFWAFVFFGVLVLAKKVRHAA